jgi:hypothetical protein
MIKCSGRTGEGLKTYGHRVVRYSAADAGEVLTYCRSLNLAVGAYEAVRAKLPGARLRAGTSRLRLACVVVLRLRLWLLLLLLLLLYLQRLPLHTSAALAHVYAVGRIGRVGLSF